MILGQLTIGARQAKNAPLPDRNHSPKYHHSHKPHQQHQSSPKSSPWWSASLSRALLHNLVTLFLPPGDRRLGRRRGQDVEGPESQVDHLLGHGLRSQRGPWTDSWRSNSYFRCGADQCFVNILLQIKAKYLIRTPNCISWDFLLLLLFVSTWYLISIVHLKQKLQTFCI